MTILSLYMMLANVNVDISASKRITFVDYKMDCSFHFEWHSKNKVGYIGVLVLWIICKKLYSIRGLNQTVTVQLSSYTKSYYCTKNMGLQ